MGKHLITVALALFALSWSSNIDLVSARSRSISTEAIKEDFKAAMSAFDAIFNWTMAILPKVKLSDFQHYDRLNKTIKENAALSAKKANETRYQRSDSDNFPTSSSTELPELESKGTESNETSLLSDNSNSNSDAEAEQSEATTKAPSSAHSLINSSLVHFTALFFVFTSSVIFYI